MAGRTAARSTTGRDHASSPTKAGKRVNKSRSPVKRTIRTRSASRDLNEPEVDTGAKRARRPRALRGSSVESAGSASTLESRGERKYKKAHTAVATAGDLSVVAEEPEREQVDKQTDETTKITQLSPDDMSNLSGTTALTSQSEQKMAEFDTGMIVELIPDLSREAFQLLDLLAPLNVSPEFVETVIKELQVPGSGRGKRLRLREKTFDSIKENYGGDHFINTGLIMRKLFSGQEPGLGDFRPDVILHAANIAILMKDLLVAQRDNPTTIDLLQRVDNALPTQFLSSFTIDPKFGGSALLIPTFRLTLDLRTQYSIAIFNAYQDQVNFDPYELLAALFYEPPAQRDESLSRYQDLVKNGQSKMGRIYTEALPLSEEQGLDQRTELFSRVEAIQEAFNVEGISSIDYVDFEKLHDRFPWTNFLTNIVHWCQLRLDEINRNIEMQGGIDSITGLLVDRVKSSNGNVELYYEPPKASQPRPEILKSKNDLHQTTPIIPASAGKSLYNSSKSLQALLKKPLPESTAPPSNQQHPAAPVRDGRVEGEPVLPQTSQYQKHGNVLESTAPYGVARNPDLVNLLHEDDISDGGESSIAEVLSLHFEGETYNHKENQPVFRRDDPKARKLRFVDRQPNAERVSWSEDRDDGEDSEVELYTSHRKRSHHHIIEDNMEENEKDEEDEEDEEGEEDDDETFEIDPRPVDQSRREKAALPANGARNERQLVRPSPKRRRIERREGEEDLIAATQEDGTRQAPFLDAAVRASTQENNSAPSSSYPAVRETARAVMAIYRSPKKPKQRLRWSYEETEALVNLIDKFGCSWSKILKEGEGQLEPSRDQVALKDKARNIKVDFLIAGSVLPRHFDYIALGKKERERVKAAQRNPYRLEGEDLDEETYDMDGKLKKKKKTRGNTGPIDSNSGNL